MTVFATSGVRHSNVVKHEYEPSLGYCRDVVVLNDAAATLPVGSVLGKVTATGKYKLCEATAADGSQNAVAILIGNSAGEGRATVLVANTDTKVVALTRGPVIVSKGALTFGASVDTQPELDAAYASLKAVGILAETTI